MATTTYFGGAGGGSLSLGINNFTSVSTLDYEHDGNVLFQLIPAPAEMLTPSIQLSACSNNGVNGPTSALCKATYNGTDPYGMFKSVDAQGYQRIRASFSFFFSFFFFLFVVCLFVCLFVCFPFVALFKNIQTLFADPNHRRLQNRGRRRHGFARSCKYKSNRFRLRR